MGCRLSALQNILTAMADQIRTTLDGATDLGLQVEPQPVLSPTPITIDIVPGSQLRDLPSAAFGDDGAILLTVRAYINTPDFDAAYAILVALMSDDDALSIGQSLLDEPTLNGYATDVDVRDQTGLIFIQALDGNGYLGFQFTAFVLPARS